MSLQLPAGYLYGKTVRGHKLANFELSERVYPPHFKTPVHEHKEALFCFVMQGDYTETYGTKTRVCRSSTLLFHPRHEPHAEHFHESGGRSFIIEIEPMWLEHIREHFAVADNSADFYRGVMELLARKLYKEFTAMDETSALIIEGLILEMIGETSRRCSSGVNGKFPRWLEQAREMLHSQYKERLTLAGVAQTVGVHPVYLAQMFRKSYRCTVGEYIRQLRIEYACHELAASEKTMAEIASSAGFYDQSHFTKIFKRVTGGAPSQYRESLRKT